MKCQLCGKTIFKPYLKKTQKYHTECGKIVARKRSLEATRKFNESVKEKNQLLYSARSDTFKCEICGKFYVKIGDHVVQAHKIRARDYREQYGFDVKKGQTAGLLHETLKDNALKNGTYKNLEAGAKYRFKKGQTGIGTYKRSEQTLQRLKLHNRRISA